MSEEGTEQDRSEQPTPYKLARARQRGAVARGMDLGFLTGLAAFSAYLWFLGGSLGGDLANLSRGAIVAAAGVSASPNELLTLSGSVLGGAARPLALMFGAVFLAVLVFEFVQTGPVFSGQPLKLDFSRLNPAQGLKRLFSVRMLVQAAKNVLKMVAYGALAWLAVRGAVEAGLPVVTDVRALAGGLWREASRMLGLFLACAAAFAVLDQLIARRDFFKRMRMSRRELKREARDREGDPRLKQRRKQLHREFSSASESLRGVRGADVLITNPTHYAVALRYDPRSMDAPQVVSRGAHRFALRLRRVAFLYGVTIVREPALARALFRCELNRPIPEALYGPVARIYRGLRAPAAGEAAHV